jgi:hypothetical protein
MAYNISHHLTLTYQNYMSELCVYIYSIFTTTYTPVIWFFHMLRCLVCSEIMKKIVQIVIVNNSNHSAQKYHNMCWWNPGSRLGQSIKCGWVKDPDPGLGQSIKCGWVKDPDPGLGQSIKCGWVKAVSYIMFIYLFCFSRWFSLIAAANYAFITHANSAFFQ